LDAFSYVLLCSLLHPFKHVMILPTGLLRTKRRNAF